MCSDNKIEIQTSIGILRAVKSENPENPGIFISIQRNEEAPEIDLCGVELQQKDVNPLIAGYVWSNPDSEQWTNKYIWSGESLNV